MKLKYIIPFVFFVVGTKVNGQQKAQFTQYYVNPYVLNQAYGGTTQNLEASVGYRKQWAGFKDAPSTLYGSFFIPYNRKPDSQIKHSKYLKNRWNTIGAMIYSDVTGPTSRSGVHASYAQNLALTSKLRVSFAVTGGFQQFSYNNEGLEIADDGDGVLNTGRNEIVPDVNVSMWLYGDNFYAGFSSNQLLRNKLFYDQNSLINNSNLERHYYLQLGFRVYSGYEWNHYIMSMSKFVANSPFSPEAGYFIKYKSDFWFGANYRIGDALDVMAGLRLNSFIDLTYSYGISISAITPHNYGNHEIVLIFKKKHPTHLLCPRDFW